MAGMATAGEVLATLGIAPTSDISETAYCDVCGATLETTQWGGKWCPVCAEAARIEEAAVAREEAERRRVRAEQRGIPARYRAAEFKNCDPRNPTVAAVAEWVKAPSGIILIHGGCGRGKTYLAAAAKKEFNRAGRASLFVQEREILTTIKGTFRDGAEMTEREAYRCFTRPDILLVDDIGISRVSEFTFDVWEEIIGHRYDEELPILLTSNFGFEALLPRLGDRVVDRIRESKMVYELTGKNRRA